MGRTVSTSFSAWSNNPDTLPRAVADASAIGFKTAVGTVVLTNAAGCQTTLATRGATATITADDTYVTVCDVTGSGFLFHVLSAAGTASDLRTIKITLDGVVYILATADAIPANSRLVLGAVLAGTAPTTSTGTLTADPGALVGYNLDFFAARDGGCPSYGNVIYIPTENEVLSRNFPAIRFESSLKVEAKSQTKSGTADPYNAAVALYRVDL